MTSDNLCVDSHVISSSYHVTYLSCVFSSSIHRLHVNLWEQDCIFRQVEEFSSRAVYTHHGEGFHCSLSDSCSGEDEEGKEFVINAGALMLKNSVK